MRDTHQHGATPMGVSTSLDTNGSSKDRSTLDPPRRIPAIFAGLIEAEPVARRIGQPRLAPTPSLVARHRVSTNPAPPQLRDPPLARPAFQIGGRPGFPPPPCGRGRGG